jgi:hypothetical protein
MEIREREREREREGEGGREWEEDLGRVNPRVSSRRTVGE